MNANRITSNICGVCEQALHKRKVAWDNPFSAYAHPICLQWINRENTLLQNLLNQYFPEKGFYRNNAQKNVVQEIKNKIGDISILEYRKSQGSEALASILTSEKIHKLLSDWVQSTQTHHYDWRSVSPEKSKKPFTNQKCILM